MISALEFYRLQKNKRLPAEKRALMESTISMVSTFSNQINDLEDTRLIIAQNPEEIKAKHKEKKRKLKKARLSDKKKLAEKSQPIEKTRKISKTSLPNYVIPNSQDSSQPLSAFSVSKMVQLSSPSIAEPISAETDPSKSCRKRRKLAKKGSNREITQLKRNREEICEDVLELPELPLHSFDENAINKYAEEFLDNMSHISKNRSIDESDASEEVTINPVHIGYELLESLLKPISYNLFTSEYFGLKPLHSVGGTERVNFCNWLKLVDVNAWLYDELLMFGKDVECIGSDEYSDSFRALNRGRAFRSVVWNHLNLGGSLRFNAPERFSYQLARGLHLLQEVMGGPISSALVLTTSTFAGSLLETSINADLFILQLEGFSDFTCTDPSSSSDSLRRNTEKQQIEKRKFEYSLAPGDVVYLPRIFQHSAKVRSGERAVHLCILQHTASVLESCMIDLLKDSIQSYKLLLPSVHLTPSSAEKDPSYPLLCLESYTQNAYQSIAAKLSTLGNSKALKSERDAHDAFSQEIADKLAINLLRVTAAPVLLQFESACHVSEQGEIWCASNENSSDESSDDIDDDIVSVTASQKPGHIVLGVELEPDSQIRLVRRSCLHLVVSSEGKHRLYHCMNNGRQCLVLKESSYLDIHPEHIKLIQRLFEVYPENISISDLPGDSIDEKMIFTNRLYEVGIIITGKELPPCPWNDSD